MLKTAHLLRSASRLGTREAGRCGVEITTPGKSLVARLRGRNGQIPLLEPGGVRPIAFWKEAAAVSALGGLGTATLRLRLLPVSL